jgi:hypothetical protein
MVDDLGTIVEVFPMGTSFPIPDTVRTIAVLRINYVGLKRECEKLTVLTEEDRPHPIFLFEPNALSGIYLGRDLPEVAAKGPTDFVVLPFRHAKKPKATVTRRVKRPKIPR